MRELLGKFRDWDKRRSRRVTLERWPSIRAKGRGVYVLKTGLFFTACYAVIFIVWEWVKANGVSIYGGFPPAMLSRLFYEMGIGYITGCVVGWLNWDSAEKRYLKLTAIGRNNKETAI